MKNLALLLIATVMATTTFAQNDPLSMSQQRAFQSGNYPVYTTGGFKVLVRNNTTGLLNITSYAVTNDTINSSFVIKGTGVTGHGLDLTTNIFAPYFWAGQNRAGGKTKLMDTTGTYYSMSTSDSGQYDKYPLSVTNQVLSVSNKAGLKYGLGSRGQGYLYLQDSGATDKHITIDPLSGITSKDTLFGVQKHISLKTASGNVALTADTAQATINSGKLRIGAATAPMIKSGSGTPLYVISAPVGSIYMRTNGVQDSAVYIKHAGTDSAGWWPIPHN
jgi:hypothetical protein